MASRNDPWYHQAANAKVFIGSILCGTLPGTLIKGKVYQITCDTAGDFVRIESGGNALNDPKVNLGNCLALSEVEVYTKSDYSDSKRTIVESSASKESYSANWYNRGVSFPEDPWISIHDHHTVD